MPLEFLPYLGSDRGDGDVECVHGLDLRRLNFESVLVFPYSPSRIASGGGTYSSEPVSVRMNDPAFGIGPIDG